MSTGDLLNNIRKLKTKLKTLKYSSEIEVNGVREGSPTAYLPVYHHAFTSYSPALTEAILAMGIEMFGKSDARFMETVYKVLRDMFSYKPPITKDQFFAKGYAERKVIMCTDVLQFVIIKSKALNPAPSKTALKTSVRPKSSVDTRTAVPKTKRPSTATSSHANRMVDYVETSPRGAPQVVNELTSNLPTVPLRHVSPLISHTNLTRHVAASSSVSQPQPEKHVTIQSPPSSNRPHPSAPGLVQGSLDRGDNSDTSLESERANYAATFNTPSISRVCKHAVEVVRIPRGQMSDLSILDIQAPTADSILQSPAPKSHSTSDVHKEMSDLYKTVETLTEHVMMFDSTLKEVQESQRSSSGTDPYIVGLTQRIQGQLEEVRARLVLVENRVSLVEVKKRLFTCEGIYHLENYNCYALIMDQIGRSSSIGPSPSLSAHLPAHQPITALPTQQPTTVLPTHQPTTVLPTQQPTTVLSTQQPTTVLPTQQPIAVLPTHQPTTVLSTQRATTTIHPESSFEAEFNSERAQTAFHDLRKESNVDFSLNYSPIRKATNGMTGTVLSANEDTFALETEDDARRASTPTGGLMDSLICTFNDTATNDIVQRTKAIMLQTTAMLKARPTTTTAAGAAAVSPPDPSLSTDTLFI